MDGAISKISVGDIVNETLAIVRRNLKPFAIVAVLFVLLPQAVAAWFQLSVLRSGGDDGLWGLIMLPIGLVSLLGQAALLVGALEDQRGHRLAFGEMIAGGAGNFGRILLISIVMGFCLAIGFVLFLVPGLILTTMWAVAEPAYLARKAGLGAALSESAALTKGNRWRILGLIGIYILTLIVLMIVIGVVSFIAGPTGILVGQAIAATVQSVLGSAGLVALYSALDRNRGGLSAAAVAKTFD